MQTPKLGQRQRKRQRQTLDRPGRGQRRRLAEARDSLAMSGRRSCVESRGTTTDYPWRARQRRGVSGPSSGRPGHAAALQIQLRAERSTAQHSTALLFCNQTDGWSAPGLLPMLAATDLRRRSINGAESQQLGAGWKPKFRGGCDQLAIDGGSG